MSGKFTKINEAFQCLQCGREVPPATSTCRNHCPFCLHSRHVDQNPGDRANACQGLMAPTGYRQDSHKGLLLYFRCQACGAEKSNIALLDDRSAPDDYDAILRLPGVTRL